MENSKSLSDSYPPRRSYPPLRPFHAATHSAYHSPYAMHPDAEPLGPRQRELIASYGAQHPSRPPSPTITFIRHGEYADYRLGDPLPPAQVGLRLNIAGRQQKESDIYWKAGSGKTADQTRALGGDFEPRSVSGAGMNYQYGLTEEVSAAVQEEFETSTAPVPPIHPQFLEPPLLLQPPTYDVEGAARRGRHFLPLDQRGITTRTSAIPDADFAYDWNSDDAANTSASTETDIPSPYPNTGMSQQYLHTEIPQPYPNTATPQPYLDTTMPPWYANEGAVSPVAGEHPVSAPWKRRIEASTATHLPVDSCPSDAWWHPANAPRRQRQTVDYRGREMPGGDSGFQGHWQNMEGEWSGRAAAGEGFTQKQVSRD